MKIMTIMFPFVLLVLTPVGSSLAAPGDIDPSFILITDLGGASDTGRAVAIQTDGKIVVAGESQSIEQGFSLARYNPDGTLDNNFGWGGKKITTFGYGRDANGYAVAIQTDGKIVVAGRFRYGGNDDFALARYNTDGNLDTSFGRVNTHLGGIEEEGNAVAIQTDGKIIVAGRSDAGGDDDFALARYNTDGNTDNSFHTDGRVTTDFGSGDDSGKAVAIQTDGKIIVAGYADNGSNKDFALARYFSSGILDASFGTGGQVTTDFGGSDSGNAVAIQTDGKIIVAGRAHNGSNHDFALARYNPDGNLDTNFGTGGKVTTGFSGTDYGYAVAIQTDGRIIVAGKSGDNDFALARYNPDGNLDTSFGTGGKVTTDFVGGADRGYGVAIQTDGKIIVAGYARNGSYNDFAVARYYAGLWSVAADVGGEWRWLDWFGYFNVSSDPWIFHEHHGFLYPFGSTTASIFFYDLEMAQMWWTSDTEYPFLYRFSDTEWLWYCGSCYSGGTRWFVRMSDGGWESY